jgi:AI-2 transport protein TqsA
VFLFVLYMLFEDGDGATEQGINAGHARARNLRKQIDQQIQRYIVIKTLISLGVGLAVYVVLGPILGVKMAHIFAVITFFANYIPNVGAMLATMFPIPVVILDPTQTTLTAILVIALPVLIHSLVGNVVEPKIFGDTMELHPVVVLISLSFWYTVWGIPGAILSVPITAVMRIVLSNIRHPYAYVILCLLEGKLPGSAAFHHADY